MNIEEKLIHWVWDFCSKHKLLCFGDSVGVGASFGADSRLLLWLTKEFLRRGYLKRARVLHVNYKARGTSDLEEQKLKELCVEYQMDFYSKTVTLNLKDSDFEGKARRIRKSFFREHEHFVDKVLLGHQIDDSFEWYLRNIFRSAHYPSSLGIPVKYHKTIRPLHCLSASQVRYLARLFDLDYIDDESNWNLRYERNWLRWKLVKPIKAKYPNALKNYVIKANIEARKRNLSVFSSSQVFIQRKKNICLLYQFSSSVSTFESQEDAILECIHELSSHKRGELREQIQKIILSHKNGRQGPFSLSHGVKCWSFPRVLIFANKTGEKQFKNYYILDSQIPSEEFYRNPQPFYKLKKKTTKEDGLKKNSLIQEQIDLVRQNGYIVKPFGYFFSRLNKDKLTEN